MVGPIRCHNGAHRGGAIVMKELKNAPLLCVPGILHIFGAFADAAFKPIFPEKTGRINKVLISLNNLQRDAWEKSWHGICYYFPRVKPHYPFFIVDGMTHFGS